MPHFPHIINYCSTCYTRSSIKKMYVVVFCCYILYTAHEGIYCDINSLTAATDSNASSTAREGIL